MKLPFVFINTTFLMVIAAWFSAFSFQNIGYSQLSNNGLAKKTSADFKAFVKLFPSRDLPYKLGATELNAWILRAKQKNNNNLPMAKQTAASSIAESFGDFIPSLNAGRFSRMGPDIFYPEALLAINDKNVAVVYSRARGYSRNYASYYLVTYTTKGKRIDEVFVGGSKGYKNFTGCTITKAQNGNLLVAVQEYENKWKNDGDYYAENNQIVASNLKSSAYKMVSPDGAIASVQTP